MLRMFATILYDIQKSEQTSFDGRLLIVTLNQPHKKCFEILKTSQAKFGSDITIAPLTDTSRIWMTRYLCSLCFCDKNDVSYFPFLTQPCHPCCYSCDHKMNVHHAAAILTNHDTQVLEALYLLRLHIIHVDLFFHCPTVFPITFHFSGLISIPRICTVCQLFYEVTVAACYQTDVVCKVQVTQQAPF